MLTHYCTVSVLVVDVAHLCTVFSWQCRCLLMWCSCEKKGGLVFVWLRHIYITWSFTCSAMRIDLCALKWYGCLLVALDISVYATISNSFHPVDGILMLMCRSLLFLSQTSCYWINVSCYSCCNMKLNCSFTMLLSFINYAFNLST